MRLIDADALKQKAFGKRGGLLHTSDIDEAPTVDAVEVVRCEDCKNWNGVLHGGFYYFETCELTSISTNSGDYCSFAEKKEGESDATD